MAPGLWFINEGQWMIYEPRTGATVGPKANTSSACSVPGAGVKPTGAQGVDPAGVALPSRDAMVMKYPGNTSKNNLTATI